MYANYFVNIFWIIFITLIFSFISLIILLNIKKSFLDFKKRKIISIFFEFIFGLIFGLFSLYYFFIEHRQTNGTQIIFLLALCIPIMFMFGFSFQVGSYISILFCSLQIYLDKPIFIFFQFILLFSIFLKYVLNFSEKISEIAKILIFIFIFSIAVFIYFEVIGASYFLPRWEINISIFVCLILLVSIWLLLLYSEKVFQKTIFLRKKIEYENGIFINANFSHDKILDFVAKKNISTGFLCVFQLKQIYLSDQINFLKNGNAIKYWELFRKQFQLSETIFFKTKNNNFAFFLGNRDKKIQLNTIYNGNLLEQRTHSDILSQLEEIVLKINNLEIKTSTEGTLKYKFNFYCSIYGIHSNDPHELEKNAELISRTSDEKNKNQILCFDPNESYENLNDFIKFDNLKKIINLEKIKVIFNSTTIGKSVVFYPHYFYGKKLFSVENLGKSLIVPKEFEEILVKHLSAVAIKRFSKDLNSKNNILSVDYPLSSLYSQFDVKRIFRYLHFYKIPRENILLTIDLKNQIVINEQIKQAILLLKKKKIGFAFRNIGEQQFEICEEFKPSLCFAKKIYDKSDQIANEYYDNLINLYESICINMCKPL